MLGQEPSRIPLVPSGDDGAMSTTREAAIEPELPICDPHFHLGPRSSVLGDFIDAGYLLDDLDADLTAGHDVRQTVYVECGTGRHTDGPIAMQPVGETEWVVGLGPGQVMAAGIVGRADLTLGAAVEEVLVAHVDAADGRFRGIRQSASWDADPSVGGTAPRGMLADAGFRAGMAVLGRMGLSFDAWLFFPQLPDVVALARAYPDIVIVLNHLGGPTVLGPYAGGRDEWREAWHADLRAVAACENVVVKLGGIGMPMFGTAAGSDLASDELVRRWGPDVRWCIDTFGSDRCMFESNFPVDRLACGYVELWNAFKKMTSDASPTERADLFQGTAMRAYRL